MTRTIDYRREQRTDQQAFDVAAKHLLQQGRMALGERGQPVYVSANGDRCAIGCLIPASAYSSKMEGRAAGELRREYAELRRFLPSRRVCIALQSVHDMCPVDRWAEALRYVASTFTLGTQVIDEWEATRGKNN